MKNKFTLLFITLFLSHYIIGQNGPNDVVFNVQTNTFSVKPTSVTKGETGGIYLKHYNPFGYSKNIAVKNNDDAAKIFPFIIGVFGNYFGVKIQALSFSGTYASDNYKTFVKNYNDHLELITEVRKHYFDCNSVSSGISKLANYGKNIIELYTALTLDELKLHPEITVTRLMEIQGIIQSIINYNKKMTSDNCYFKVAKYKAKGTSVSIGIELIPREEAIFFGFPKDKIIGKTTLSIDNTFKLSFSSGLFASFHVEPDYFINQDSNGFMIKTEDRGSALPGVNTLAHLSISNIKDFSIILGGGITIDAIPHFLAGGSVRLFDSNVNLNMGYGWALGKTLSDGLDAETTYTAAPTIKTKKTLLGTFWFGLSYKL